MKTIKILPLVALLFFGLTAAQNNTSKQAIELLEKAKKEMQSHKNQVIQFTNIIETPAPIAGEPSRKLTEKGTITLAGDQFRLEYGGNIYLNDGKRTFIIMPDDMEVSLLESGEDDDIALSPTKILESFSNNKYSYKLGSIETINGKKVQNIILKPVAAADVALLEVGIDVNTNRLVTFTETGMNKVVTKFIIDKMTINTTLAADFFTFKRADYPGYYIPKF
ncbi:MAG: outer membrane lipoprotein carrier protein LolA [Schleiferiaceae bacterium]|nr:outer membrane lipoprotein carrier protein LolA [Schleiferiaceae bacterium]